jgi:hypothetical protein
VTATPKRRIELLIIDRPGVSAGCTRGATDPALPAFAGDLEWLRWQGVAVRRIDRHATAGSSPATRTRWPRRRARRIRQAFGAQ